MGFHNERIREQLGGLLQEENQQLAKQVERVRKSPIAGISSDTWGILLNAVIDGLAIQALLVEDFPTKEVYAALGRVILLGMGEKDD